MTYNPMSHVGLETAVDPAILSRGAGARHYGWKWKGNENYPECECQIAACGLVGRKSNDCPCHRLKLQGSAKQMHWAKDCPGA